MCRTYVGTVGTRSPMSALCDGCKGQGSWSKATPGVHKQMGAHKSHCTIIKHRLPQHLERSGLTDKVKMDLIPLAPNVIHVQRTVWCWKRRVSYKYVCSYARAIQVLVFCISVWAFGCTARVTELGGADINETALKLRPWSSGVWHHVVSGTHTDVLQEFDRKDIYPEGASQTQAPIYQYKWH